MFFACKRHRFYKYHFHLYSTAYGFLSVMFFCCVNPHQFCHRVLTALFRESRKINYLWSSVSVIFQEDHYFYFIIFHVRHQNNFALCRKHIDLLYVNCFQMK